MIEQLVGATLILQSNGKLRVSVPLVDDEGVDLIIGNRENDKTLLLQIKSRFSLTGKGLYQTQVRRATCSSNPNKFLLFLYYDKDEACFRDECWLVSASDFCGLLSGQKAKRDKYVFASSFSSEKDMWARFKCSFKDLAEAILRALR
ncbi:MAG: hypothetical protein HYV26_16905 [Candidatus Hydrogenedentes bacterium]|nr:hypothetical protein [Candidatus Hydrogenedentota bacterium]